MAIKVGTSGYHPSFTRPLPLLEHVNVYSLGFTPVKEETYEIFVLLEPGHARLPEETRKVIQRDLEASVALSETTSECAGFINSKGNPKINWRTVFTLGFNDGRLRYDHEFRDSVEDGIAKVHAKYKIGQYYNGPIPSGTGKIG